MLMKLMKYELKATARILIPLYVVLLSFAIINYFFIGTGNIDEIEGFGSIPFILSLLGYGCTMTAVFIMTFFVIIQRFYKNLLGDEGYLMNTLPVSPMANITSKISIAVFWNIISGLVAILSIVIMSFNPVDFAEFFSEISKGWSEVHAEIGAEVYIVLAEVIGAMFIYLLKSLSMIYASISIGHLFNKHKILFAFGAFIVLNLISTAVTSTIGIAFSYSDLISHFGNIESSFPIHLFFGFIIIFNLVFFLIYFAISNYILKYKLNLE